MEETKEKWYEVFYNTKLDKLVLKKPKISGKINRIIRRHKILVTAFLAFITFSILNLTMIISFLKVLQNI